MPIRLDERLTAIAVQIRCRVAADIGCDHGKLGYYLLQTDRAETVIATDISASSLRKTEKLALENGVESRLLTRVGDGLEPLESGEADVVVIAGMGGDLIAEIIEKAYADGKRFPSFLLSPNTHPERVRSALLSSGHNIVSDGLTECGKKYYNIILSSACGGGARECEPLDGKQMLFGKFFRTDKNFAVYAEKQLDETEALLKTYPTDKLLEKARLLREALEECNDHS